MRRINFKGCINFGKNKFVYNIKWKNSENINRFKTESKDLQKVKIWALHSNPMIRSPLASINSDRLKILTDRTIHNSLSLKKDRTAPQITNNCFPHYHQSIQTKQTFSQCHTELVNLSKKNTMRQKLL